MIPGTIERGRAPTPAVRDPAGRQGLRQQRLAAGMPGARHRADHLPGQEPKRERPGKAALRRGTDLRAAAPGPPARRALVTPPRHPRRPRHPRLRPHLLAPATDGWHPRLRQLTMMPSPTRSSTPRQAARQPKRSAPPGGPQEHCNANDATRATSHPECRPNRRRLRPSSMARLRQRGWPDD